MMRPRRDGSFVILAISLLSCSEPTQVLPCTEEIDGRCWVYLGIDSTQVTSFALFRQQIFAGTTNGLIRYDPHDNQWSPVAFAGKSVTSVQVLPPGDFMWVTIAPHGSDSTLAVAYSSNDGSSWYARDGGLSATAGYHGLAFSFDFDSSDPERLLLGQAAQIARSPDAGTTWELTFGSPANGGVGILAIEFASSGVGRVWAGGQNAIEHPIVLRSDDRGENWTLLSLPPTPGDAVASLLTQPGSPRVFAGMYAAVRSSVDDGATWQTVLSTNANEWIRSLAYVGDSLLVVADRNTGTSSRLMLYLSLDHGGSWDSVTVPAAAAGGSIIGAGFQQSILVGTRAGLWMIR